jgi:hypothetical protein
MIQFYKPNPKVTGTACSFWLNDDGSIMSSMIKQDSWDSQKRIGSFSKNKDNPKGKAIVKFSTFEIGGIIDALESNRPFSAYHSSKNQITKINFGPYVSKKENKQIGFSYSINKEDKEDSTNKIGFIIGFNYGEGRLLKEYLCEVLRNGFNLKVSHQTPRSFNEPESPSTPNRGDLDDEDVW